MTEGWQNINNQDITSAVLKSTLVPAQSNIITGIMKHKGVSEFTTEVTGAVISETSGNDIDNKVGHYITP